MASFTERKGRWTAVIRRRGIARSRTFSTKQEASEWADRVEQGLLGVDWKRKKADRDGPARTPNQLLSKLEVLNLAQKHQMPSGIYFLILKREIVYVGQSINIFERVLRHIREDSKDFDSYSYVSEEPGRLNTVETQYIKLFRPKYNFDEYGFAHSKELP